MNGESTLQDALRHLLERTATSAPAQHQLTRLITHLERLAVKGLAEKLREYTHPVASLENLTAELRLGLAVASVTRSPVEFQSGEAADLRIRDTNLDCTMEIEHKSSASPFSAVFYPTPEMLMSYARDNEEWKRASVRLQSVVAALPFEVHPWVDAELCEPHWAHQERAAQVEACGAVADWLAEELRRVPLGHETVLIHPLARFDLAPVDAAPGRIVGSGPLDAYLLHEQPADGDDRLSLSGWLARSIRRKSEIAAKHPERRGTLHIIGLVVDEAFACTGHALANTFLGGLVAETRHPDAARVYRAVPESDLHLLAAAQVRGRAGLLRQMHFESDARGRGQTGLVFEKQVREQADGIVALYYTEGLQFLPNPFTAHDIDLLCSLFPQTLEPSSSWQYP